MNDFETVREGLENPSCEERTEGEVTWREHEAGEALAALDRIKAEVERLRAALRTIGFAHPDRAHDISYAALTEEEA